MSWSTQRRILYALSGIFVLAAIGLYVFREKIVPQASCFDIKKNGVEQGVDCGGSCSLVCKNDVRPITVLWSQAIASTPTSVDLVAFISNKNTGSAPYGLGYTFIAYNATGTPIFTINGTTTAPLDQEFPIIVQGVRTALVPTTVSVQLQYGDSFVTPQASSVSPFRVTGISYEEGSIPRVYATIVNTKRMNFSNVPVRVLLYDANNNVYAVGESTLLSLGREESKQIVITWKSKLQEAPKKIQVYPILDPYIQVQ